MDRLPVNSPAVESEEDTDHVHHPDIVIKREPSDLKDSSSSETLSENTDTKDGYAENIYEEHDATNQMGLEGVDLRKLFSWTFDTESRTKYDPVPWRSCHDLQWQSYVSASAFKPFAHESGTCLAFKNGDELNASALDYFHLFVPKSIFQIAYKETNNHAEFYQDQKRDSGREWWDWVDDHWFPIEDKDEMQTFLGICLVMGVKGLPNPYDYWSSNENLREKLVADSMSADRFSKLMQYFYLSNPWRDPERIENRDRRVEYCLREPLYKLGDSMWPAVQHGCSTLYEPHQDLVLRQLSIATKNRLNVKGAYSEDNWKTLTLEDANNGYIYNAEFYMVDNHQKDSSDGGVFPSEDQLSRLLADGVGRDHCIYADAVYISPLTACKLVDLGFQISANCSSWPQDLSDDHMMACDEEHKSFQYKEVVASAWQLGANIHRHLRSFDDRQTDTLPTDRIPDKDASVCPAPIAQHNLMVKNREERYLLSNSTLLSVLSKSDWKVMFWLMVDIALHNACVLWRENGRDAVSLTEFTMEVALGLLGAEGSTRRKHPILDNKQKVKMHQIVPSFPQMFHRSLLVQVSPTLSPSPDNGNPSAQDATENIQIMNPLVHGPIMTPLDEYEHSLVRFPGRGRNCRQCTAEKLRTRSGRRRDTQFGCNVCGINLCRATCFIKFHNQHKLKVNRLSITRIATLDFQPPARRVKTL